MLWTKNLMPIFKNWGFDHFKLKYFPRGTSVPLDASWNGSMIGKSLKLASICSPKGFDFMIWLVPFFSTYSEPYFVHNLPSAGPVCSSRVTLTMYSYSKNVLFFFFHYPHTLCPITKSVMYKFCVYFVCA